MRPDDGDVRSTATPISMNEVINARIEEYGDIDWFSLTSLGPGQDGVLEIITQSDNDAEIDIVFING